MQLHELCDSIRATIQTDFDATYRVTAEISSLSAKAGGHCFMELIEKRDDKTSSSKLRSSADIIAKVRATCWANVWSMLSAYFLDATGMQLQPGMQVELDVNVDFHPVYGLSLVVVGVNPEFTLGGLMRQRRETIARLEKEGMMELQPALSLPTLVRRVAVISAADAAGYQDFTDQLRQSGYAFFTQLFPATMQGEAAPFTIMAALDKIYASGTPFDLVVIIRGGGANTDLTCFATTTNSVPSAPSSPCQSSPALGTHAMSASSIWSVSKLSKHLLPLPNGSLRAIRPRKTNSPNSPISSSSR